MSANRGIVTDTLIVSGVGVAVKLAGAVKVIVMARAFGAGDAVDSFLIAFLIPSLVADTLAGPLSAALVPGFIATRESDGKQAAEYLYQDVLARMLLLLLAMAVTLGLTASYLLPLIASRFAPAKLTLTRELLLWLLPIIPLSGLSVGWRARLIADRHFALAAAAPSLVPLTSIVAIAALGARWGAYALTAGVAVGSVLENAVLAWGLIRHNCAVLPRVRSWGTARGVLNQYLPVMAGSLAMGLSTLVDQALAARLGGGSVAAFTFGTKLVAVFLSIVATGVNTATLPHLSRLAAASDWQGVMRTLRSTGKVVLAVTIPITIVLIVTSSLLVRLFFQHGAFTESAARLVSDIQTASFLRIPFAVLLALLAGVLSSVRANHVLLRAAIVALAVNAGLDLLLMGPMGVAGISLAGSAAQLAAVTYMAVVLRRQIRCKQPPW